MLQTQFLSFPALEINQLYLILDKAKFLCLVIKPLLTKLVQSWWLDVSLVLVSFFLTIFIDLNFVSVHENAKKKKNSANIQYSAIISSSRAS